MKRLLRRFRRDEGGATAIEYGLIAAFIALAIVAALPGIKTKLGGVFTDIDTNLATASADSDG